MIGWRTTKTVKTVRMKPVRMRRQMTEKAERGEDREKRGMMESTEEGHASEAQRKTSEDEGHADASYFGKKHGSLNSRTCPREST